MNLFAVAERWLGRLKEEWFYLGMVILMAAILALCLIPFALELERNFLVIACDTAAFHSTIVNTLHGNWFRDSAYDGPNYLGLHSMLVLLLILPVYLAFPSADTLFVLQILGICATAVPFYLVALDILKRPRPAFLCTMVAMLSPLFFHMSCAPFHPESWILALVLLAYYFYRRSLAAPFWVSFILAMSCGEQAAFIFVALGIALWRLDDGIAGRKTYARWLVAGSLGWLVLTMGVLFPLMRVPEQQNLIANHYSDWGVRSVAGLADNILQDLAKTAGMLLDPMRWMVLFCLTGVPLILAFLDRRTRWLLLLPLPVYFLMNTKEFGLYIHSYYFEFALFAAYLGLVFFVQRQGLASRLGEAVLIAAFFLNFLFLMLVVYVYAERLALRDHPLSIKMQQVFNQIPADAGVLSPHRFSAYLSGRPNMVMMDIGEENFDFERRLNEIYPVTNVHPGQIDYIFSDLFDDQCGIRGTSPEPGKTPRRKAVIEKLIATGQWKIYWQDHDIVVLERVKAGAIKP